MTTQAALQKQAPNTPATREGKPSATIVEICSVRVGTTIFGIPITHIVEIVGGALPQAVPLAPEFVGGLVHYRGDVLTTVSLRQLLGMSAHDGRQDILVLESASGCFGLLVDSVGEVLIVSSADHEPNPAVLNREMNGGTEGRPGKGTDMHRHTFFNGVYKLKESLLVTLDPERLDPMRLDATWQGATVA
jgi:purine-binding chemotaxis protein CheW